MNNRNAQGHTADGPARSARRATAAVAAIALAIALAGCTRTIIENRLDTGYRPGDAAGELDFWHGLAERSAVSNDEGLHGLFLLADGEDTHETYERRVEEARARGWVGRNWDEPPELAMRRGILSRALVRICDIDGGVMMRITGGIPRYAQRELIFKNIMPMSTSFQTISGLDYIGVISRAQDYITIQQQRRRDAEQPPQNQDQVS